MHTDINLRTLQNNGRSLPQNTILSSKLMLIKKINIMGNAHIIINNSKIKVSLYNSLYENLTKRVVIVQLPSHV